MTCGSSFSCRTSRWHPAVVIQGFWGGAVWHRYSKRWEAVLSVLILYASNSYHNAVITQIASNFVSRIFCTQRIVDLFSTKRVGKERYSSRHRLQGGGNLLADFAFFVYQLRITPHLLATFPWAIYSDCHTIMDLSQVSGLPPPRSDAVTFVSGRRTSSSQAVSRFLIIPFFAVLLTRLLQGHFTNGVLKWQDCE